MSLLDTASLIVTPNGYKEGKLYSVIPTDGSGDLSVTRATTATRVNSAGLVELVPYNLFDYSEELNNAAWAPINEVTITANAATAPNGTATADRLQGTGAYWFFAQQKALNTGVSYTISAYVKSNTGSNQTFRLFGCGSLVSSDLTATTEWQRFEFTFTSINDITHGIARNSSSGTADLLVWGVQLNEGTLKDYQKTETRLNIPRLDYSNGTCPSLLVEPQRTNLNLYSEDLSNAWYNKFNSSISTNSTTAPSGISNADKIIENTNNSFHYVETANSLSAGSTYTISAYLKKAERDFGYIGIYTFESKQIRVDLVNGTIDNTTGTWINTKIEDAGNGWYRVSGTFDAYSTSYFFAGPALNATTVTYTGNGTSGIYLWGVQLEAGSYPTSYIPTTSASVTRNADVISKTGISSLIGQTEGTIFLDFVLKNPLSATNRIISITETDWASGGSIRLDIDYDKFTADFVNGGSNIGNIGYFTTVQPNTRYKVAIAYKVNDCQMYINGVNAGSDTTTAAMPTCSELYLNALGGGFNAPYEASNINAAALWKTRLTNAQLATLTTI